MARESFCPFLKENCIGARCSMWIQSRLQKKDEGSSDVTKDGLELCAFVWSGLAAIKAAQPLPGQKDHNVLVYLRTVTF